MYATDSVFFECSQYDETMLHEIWGSDFFSLNNIKNSARQKAVTDIATTFKRIKLTGLDVLKQIEQ